MTSLSSWDPTSRGRQDGLTKARECWEWGWTSRRGVCRLFGLLLRALRRPACQFSLLVVFGLRAAPLRVAAALETPSVPGAPVVEEMEMAWTPDGSFQLGFAGMPGTAYTVWSSPDVSRPASQWMSVGVAIEIEPGRFQFTAIPASITTAGFFRITPGVTRPLPDATSTLEISAPGSAYQVEGNIAYGLHPKQRLDVMYPVGEGPAGTTALPGVILFHGGGWVDANPAVLKASMSPFFNRFLAHGFVVCNVEYRVADGTPDGAIAPAAVQDALLAAKWFWDHLDYYHVDRTRYVVTGASAGAHLAMMVGLATPAAHLGPTHPKDYKIAAIVNGYGPTDLTELLALRISWAEQWLPTDVPDRAGMALRLSPITYARQDIPPFLTVQGAYDEVVPISQSEHLIQLLQAAGADTSMHLVAGAGHGFDFPATAWPQAEAAIFDFLVAHGIGR